MASSDTRDIVDGNQYQSWRVCVCVLGGCIKRRIAGIQGQDTMDDGFGRSQIVENRCVPPVDQLNRSDAERARVIAAQILVVLTGIALTSTLREI